MSNNRASQDEEVSDPRRWGYASAAGTLTNNEVAARLSSAIGDYELPLSHYPSATGPATTPGGYSHNTYHGQVRHQRTPLIMDNPKPLRFIDNPPGHITSALASYHQRRRSSNASNDSEVSNGLSGKKNPIALFNNINQYLISFIRHILPLVLIPAGWIALLMLSV